MSHFTVAVLTQKGQEVEQLLAPFHEFECTGVVDEYVQNIDQMEEARAEYADAKYAKLKGPDGKLYDRWNDEFYREPTKEEQDAIDKGDRSGINYASKDWEDGQGFRTKVHFVPDHYKEVTVKATEIMSFRDFIKDYYDYKPIFGAEEPDINDKHKYGWMRLNAEGEVVELIGRSNPNKKWDWWQVGGRWQGLLLIKAENSGEEGTTGFFGQKREAVNPAPEGYKWVDSAKIGDIEWKLMGEIEKQERANLWDKVHSKEKDMDPAMKNFLYGITPEDTKETYVERVSEFCTFAVITPDGNWHEKGEMGWFGFHSATQEEEKQWGQSYMENFILNADPELTITIVDCHI